jgi:arylsulfatase
MFWVEAEKYQVLPLDASGLERLISSKSSIVAGRTEFGQKGKPVFVNLLDLSRERIEGRQPSSSGKHTGAIDFKYDGPGLAQGGAAVMLVDGVEVARQNFP